MDDKKIKVFADDMKVFRYKISLYRKLGYIPTGKFSLVYSWDNKIKISQELLLTKKTTKKHNILLD